MIDPEETAIETAARRINKAAEQYAKRADLFKTTLRVNGRQLSPTQRDVTRKWLEKVHSDLIAAMDQVAETPPLGLVEYD